ncbi:hypothetical protein Z517_10473 [Fonsecaea pedrosoi CBS 271.37]|uniref:Unplaced genomic scaffold supercont1.7, whole genome shotgun sequence n=1 Tax=Fonsecaea pedrosoi CBS 271.37 TaxID=1442368 RepID=A0A0D2GA60_9EURO|nr:uncharacterized protein Z517_10473 [Fonsecaea pedrosoi CBS 271.37]KIW75730.1 hypothetical protein Z517_10473 [Fonsecaea pedrosoi CBS 271.37]
MAFALMSSAVLSSLAGVVVAHVNVFHARQDVQTTSDLSYSALYSSCTNYAATCPPIVSSCVGNFCASCASLGGSAFISCCDQTTAADCFSSLLLATTTTTDDTTSSRAGTGSITGTASMPVDSYSASCLQVFSLIESCAAATSGFTSLDDGDQASCLCYSGSAYNPGPFDQLQSACITYASTADPSGLSVYQAAAGLCTRVGNVRSATATISITEPPAPAPTTSIPVATHTLSSLTSSTATTSIPVASGASSRQNVSTSSEGYASSNQRFRFLRVGSCSNYFGCSESLPSVQLLEPTRMNSSVPEAG